MKKTRGLLDQLLWCVKELRGRRSLFQRNRQRLAQGSSWKQKVNRMVSLTACIKLAFLSRVHSPRHEFDLSKEFGFSLNERGLWLDLQMILQLVWYLERDSQSCVGSIVHADDVLIKPIVHAYLEINVDVFNPNWQIYGRCFHVDRNLICLI